MFPRRLTATSLGRLMNWWFTMRYVPGGPILAGCLAILFVVLIYQFVDPALVWWEWISYFLLGGAAYPGDTRALKYEQHLAARRFELVAMAAWLAFLVFMGVRRL